MHSPELNNFVNVFDEEYLSSPKHHDDHLDDCTSPTSGNTDIINRHSRKHKRAASDPDLLRRAWDGEGLSYGNSHPNDFSKRGRGESFSFDVDTIKPSLTQTTYSLKDPASSFISPLSRQMSSEEQRTATPSGYLEIGGETGGFVFPSPRLGRTSSAEIYPLRNTGSKLHETSLFKSLEHPTSIEQRMSDGYVSGHLERQQRGQRVSGKLDPSDEDLVAAAEMAAAAVIRSATVDHGNNPPMLFTGGPETNPMRSSHHSGDNEERGTWPATLQLSQPLVPLMDRSSNGGGWYSAQGVSGNRVAQQPGIAMLLPSQARPVSVYIPTQQVVYAPPSLGVGMMPLPTPVPVQMAPIVNYQVSVPVHQLPTSAASATATASRQMPSQRIGGGVRVAARPPLLSPHALSGAARGAGLIGRPSSYVSTVGVGRAGAGAGGMGVGRAAAGAGVGGMGVGGAAAGVGGMGRAAAGGGMRGDILAPAPVGCVRAMNQLQPSRVVSGVTPIAPSLPVSSQASAPASAPGRALNPFNRNLQHLAPRLPGGVGVTVAVSAGGGSICNSAAVAMAKRVRGGYKCGRCGQPKNGHDCQDAVELRGAGTQIDLAVTRGGAALVPSRPRAAADSMGVSAEDGSGGGGGGRSAGGLRLLRVSAPHDMWPWGLDDDEVQLTAPGAVRSNVSKFAFPDAPSATSAASHSSSGLVSEVLVTAARAAATLLEGLGASGCDVRSSYSNGGVIEGRRQQGVGVGALTLTSKVGSIVAPPTSQPPVGCGVGGSRSAPLRVAVDDGTCSTGSMHSSSGSGSGSRSPEGSPVLSSGQWRTAPPPVVGVESVASSHGEGERRADDVKGVTGSSSSSAAAAEAAGAPPNTVGGAHRRGRGPERRGVLSLRMATLPSSSPAVYDAVVTAPAIISSSQQQQHADGAAAAGGGQQQDKGGVATAVPTTTTTLQVAASVPAAAGAPLNQLEGAQFPLPRPPPRRREVTR